MEGYIDNCVVKEQSLKVAGRVFFLDRSGMMIFPLLVVRKKEVSGMECYRDEFF